MEDERQLVCHVVLLVLEILIIICCTILIYYVCILDSELKIKKKMFFSLHGFWKKIFRMEHSERGLRSEKKSKLKNVDFGNRATATINYCIIFISFLAPLCVWVFKTEIYSDIFPRHVLPSHTVSVYLL